MTVGHKEAITPSREGGDLCQWPVLPESLTSPIPLNPRGLNYRALARLLPLLIFCLLSAFLFSLPYSQAPGAEQDFRVLTSLSFFESPS
jgi:hypothetical protein